jgi:hypothetical protein
LHNSSRDDIQGLQARFILLQFNNQTHLILKLKHEQTPIKTNTRTSHDTPGCARSAIHTYRCNAPSLVTGILRSSSETPRVASTAHAREPKGESCNGLNAASVPEFLTSRREKVRMCERSETGRARAQEERCAKEELVWRLRAGRRWRIRCGGQRGLAASRDLHLQRCDVHFSR